MEGLNFIKNKSENTKIVIYHVVIMQCLFIIMSGSIWQESTIVVITRERDRVHRSIIYSETHSTTR
jgi:hypothetical protein